MASPKSHNALEPRKGLFGRVADWFRRRPSQDFLDEDTLGMTDEEKLWMDGVPKGEKPMDPHPEPTRTGATLVPPVIPPAPPTPVPPGPAPPPQLFDEEEERRIQAALRRAEEVKASRAKTHPLSPDREETPIAPATREPSADETVERYENPYKF